MPVINQFFSADHERLDCLFMEFKRRLEESDAKAITFFQKFTAGLLRHIEWEEQVLFPFFEQHTGMKMGPTLVMCSEHELIKNLLNVIKCKVVHKDTREIPELEELQRLLAQHNMKEEKVLYPMIDNHCDPRQAATLFSQMA
ncbi:hemerythrin domain-containing protein [Thalassotalea litorea]|uniref:Hemerythrin domain-containing protein n=1 Tax=Thalassotalea litorea TaxID=2020715 RepID=A0A5R9IEE8_9GAMM|nr:hemerythrin domain-containing protein [Thalassotalea litorea]TLU61996.1 hemerythrin domain-containing protein [Thalassotalea litorea]